MEVINIKTRAREELIDITAAVQDKVSIKSGIVIVFSPHTTAGITVNENADPDVKRDILSFLGKKIPQQEDFRHIEGNSDAHIKGTLCGFSESFIIENGRLQLGTWQAIYFMEFDGPRQRKVYLKFIED